MTRRSSTYGEFAARDFAEALSYPGIDPREWISYAIVDPDGEGDDEKSTEFHPDYGPLVNVTLHPSGRQLRARVAAQIAGNGEGEWFPFMGKDEVLVCLAGGSERNAIIIGRLNQGTDGFPEIVGGVDTKKNAAAFRRMRTPYVIECAASYMITQAVTNATLLLDKIGEWTLKDGNGSALHVGGDWFGFQTKESDNVLQVHLRDGRFFLWLGNGAAAMTLDTKAPSSMLLPDTLSIAVNGNSSPTWHVVSTESVCAIVDAVLMGLSAFSAPGALSALAAPPTRWGIMSAALALASSTPLGAPVTAALDGLFVKPPVPSTPTARVPGVGVGGFLVG